jgi:hypothetical protein
MHGVTILELVTGFNDLKVCKVPGDSMVMTS